MRDVVRLLRPKQWTKGFLVFAALLFTRSYLDPALVLLAVKAFFAMALVSSATYVVNDLADVERDRNHPIKKQRPIASGAVQPGAAIAIASVCLVAGLALGAWVNPLSLGLLVLYVAIQVAYNFGIKRVPVADVFFLSSGFVLRAALGAAAISVAISGWLLFCTGALALLLGFGKRRHEFRLQGEARATSRESLQGYTMPALDALVVVSAACAAMCYGIYCIDSVTATKYPALILTSVFVFYGISRYLFLIFAQDEGGEPEHLLFRDPQLVLSVALFLVAALFALSGTPVPLIESPGGAR